MKSFVRLLFALPPAFVLVSICAVPLAFQDEPSVQRRVSIDSESVERGKRILDANDPRTLKPQETRKIVLAQEDIHLVFAYLAHRYDGAARLALEAGRAHAEVSLRPPPNPFGAYLNLDVALEETDGVPNFERLRIGALPIPGWAAGRILGGLVGRLSDSDGYRHFADVVRRIDFGEGRMSMVYRWSPDLPAQMGDALVSDDERKRLRVYRQRLAEIAAGQGSLSLANLTQPLFRLAWERSADGDGIAENRAVILALSFYVNGHDLSSIVPEVRNWSPLPFRTVTLAGREDFPKHFVVSAALAAKAGGVLSDALGVFKEIADTRGGSGFSFNDIAADRAGTRLGELAVAGEASARKLQRLMGWTRREADFMPSVEGLPEYLSEAEFARRFGGVGEPAYEKTMREIGRRVDALALSR